MPQSVCVFHNGNKRIVDHYKQMFPSLVFAGNLSEATDLPADGHLWEICYADATVANLLKAHTQGICILRHISTYKDDIENLLPECEKFDYQDWLTNVVANNLCFADQVVSDLSLATGDDHRTVIITTGRTANMHLQQVYENCGLIAFESPKAITNEFLAANDAVFLWRQDHWQCLTSTWIAEQTAYTKSHQFANKQEVAFDTVAPIELSWIQQNWLNVCLITFNQALLSKYVCDRSTVHTTTSEITKNFTSTHVPLLYNKSMLIPNYGEVELWYKQSDVANLLDILYNKVIKHLTPWSITKWA